MRRKFLSVVLCVCMMLTMVPFAFAEGDTTEGGSGSSGVTTPSGGAGGGGSTSGSSSGGGDAVAKIGETTYETLQAAVNAAESGSTITLQKDISSAEVGSNKQLQFVQANMELTLDLNEHTMTAAAGEAISLDAANITLTVKNGTIKNFTDGDYSDGLYAYRNCNNLTLTLENVTLESRTQGLAVQGLTSNSIINIKNSQITSNQGLGIYYPPKSGTLTITDSKISGVTGVVVKGSNIVIEGDKTIITGNGPNVDPEEYYTGATDGSSTLTETGDAIYIESGYNDRDISVSVSGGQIISEHAKAIRMFVKNGESTTVKRDVSVTGGTFSSDVASYVNTPYASIKQADGTYKVAQLTKDNAVAQIEGSETLYPSIESAISAASSDSATSTTINVLQDTTIGSYTAIDKNITIDFGGHKVTSAGGGFDVAVHTNGANLTLKNGTLETVSWAAWVQNGGHVTVEKDMVINTTSTDGNKGGITVQNTGSTVTVSGKITTAAGSAVSGIGNESDGGVTINIEEGAELKNTNAGGLGIYYPNTAELNIRGGLISASTGVYVKSGKTTISGGTIIGTGPKANYTYRSDGADPTGDALVIETTNYPGGDPQVTITGGNFSSNNANAIGSYAIESKTPLTAFISGGYFTTDPTAYLATGYVAGSSDLTGYNYKVTQKTDTGSVEVKPAVAAPEVKVGDKISDTDKADVTAAASSVSAPTLGAAAGDAVQKIDEAKATELIAKANQVTGADKKLYVQSALKVEPTAYNKDTKTLELRITPQYRVVASTATTADAIKLDGTGKNAQVVQDYQELSITQPTEVTMQLPTGFASSGDKLSIKHTKDNGTIEYYTGIVSVDSGKTYVTFTTNGFSPFVISAPVASIGDDVYPSLQAAVDAVQNGQTIKLEKDCAETATVSRAVNFTLNKNSKDFTGAINAGSKYNLTKANGEGTAIIYTVTYVGGGSSSSGTPTTTYAVNVNAATNGAVAADKKTASKGTTVTVTASPSKGYVVDAVKVVDKDGKDVAVTEKDGKYVFTMPASAVTVTGSFKAETPAPVALPFTDVKSGNWFYDAVKYAYAQGLMTGTSATTFAPNGTMNRAMIVTVLYRLEKSPAVTGASKFTDVPAGQWYSDAVAWAAANKIVNGYDETTFGPMNAVTREQMAAILFRYEQYKGLENVTLEENLNRFPDQNKISAYAIPALQWAVGQKIINGNADGTLDPTGTATRAQVAQIFTNLLNK